MTENNNIKELDINRAYNRVLHKLNDLGIKCTRLTPNDFQVDVPMDKLPIVKELLNKELNYLEFNIKA